MDLVMEFAQYLRESGIAEKTIESYTGDVRGFQAYLRTLGEKPKLEKKYCNSYRSHLMEMGYSIVTINKKINSLQAYNRFLKSHGKVKEDIVKLSRDRIRIASGSEKEVDTYTEEEIQQINYLIQDPGRLSARNRLILSLLLYTGMRVSELTDIKIKDIDLLTGTLKITGKGSKYREVPLREDSAELVKDYISGERKENPHSDSPYLLISQRSGKLHRDTVNYMLRNCGEKLGFHIYPHKFRHTFCSQLLKKGVPLTTVSKLAGHSSIQTTARFYINTNRQDKLEAVNVL